MQPKFSIISSLNQALHGCRFSINSPLILTEIRHFEKKKKVQFMVDSPIQLNMFPSSNFKIFMAALFKLSFHLPKFKIAISIKKFHNFFHSSTKIHYYNSQILSLRFMVILF